MTVLARPPHTIPVGKPDLGVRPRPSVLVLWTFLAGACLTTLAGLTGPPVVLAVVWIASMLAVVVAGCVAVIARSAWLHRFQVFTNMKEREGQRKC